MNWDAIGAVGEILGALAVVVTLIYLARQTKENSRAVKASSAREVTLAESQWHGELARDPELKRILMISMKVPMHSYTDDEWTEFRLLAMRTFLQFEVRHIDRDLRTGHDEQIQSRLNVARGLISAFPAWARFWKQETENGGFTQAFTDAINTVSGDAEMGHIGKGTTKEDVV